MRSVGIDVMVSLLSGVAVALGSARTLAGFGGDNKPLLKNIITNTAG